MESFRAFSKAYNSESIGVAKGNSADLIPERSGNSSNHKVVSTDIEAVESPGRYRNPPATSWEKLARNSLAIFEPPHLANVFSRGSVSGDTMKEGFSGDRGTAPKEKQRVHKCPYPGCNREMRRQFEMKYDLNLFSPSPNLPVFN